MFYFTFVGPPQPLHSVSPQRHPGQVHEALTDVEVHQGRDLEEAHVVSLGKVFSLELINLSFESQMEAISDQDLGDAGGMLVHFFEPAFDALK